MAFDANGWGFTPDDSNGMRQNQAARLKALAENLIRAFEAVELPTDHAGIDKAAKALISVTKAVKEVYALDPKPAKPEISRDDEMNDDTEATDLAEYKARAIAEDPRCADWADWQFKLERKLIDQARARRQRSDQSDSGQGLRTDGAATAGGVGDASSAA